MNWKEFWTHGQRVKYVSDTIWEKTMAKVEDLRQRLFTDSIQVTLMESDEEL